MIKIQAANEKHSEILALLGRLTYTESHGEFIADKNDLLNYNDTAFSVSKTKQELNESNNLFYIISVNDLPVGYAKLVLNDMHSSIASKNNCRLERLYILNDFIPLKLGQPFLNFLEGKAKELQLDTIWLSAYIKNYRAINFYKKNAYLAVGELNFKVNETRYENTVFSKKI